MGSPCRPRPALQHNRIKQQIRRQQAQQVKKPRYKEKGRTSMFWAGNHLFSLTRDGTILEHNV